MVRIEPDDFNSISASSNSVMETGTVAYTTSGDEANITLNQGIRWKIQDIYFYSSKADYTSSVQVFDLSSASSENQRNPAHADSHAVLKGSFSWANKQEIVFEPYKIFNTGLRVRFNTMGTVAHSIYVTVVYEPL